MFKHLEAKDIISSLENTTRQYLVGQLKLPQILAHYDDENVEIGVTSYSEYTIELPHWHMVAYEYQYMIRGETKYLDLDSGEETHYYAGDFYRIEPNTKYAQKSLTNTSILFIKTPQGNDKEIIPPTLELKKWFESWDEKYSQK